MGDSSPDDTLPATPPATSFDTSPDARPSSGSSARASLPRGTAIGRYLVLDLVGEGGMGAVYSAYDPDLGRKVAIKLLKLTGEDARSAQSRLLREAQAMARVSHPNVLTVFDAGLFGEQLFLAMELVDGVDLRAWLRERPRRRREVLQKFVAAGEGLCAAHERRLVHRDFKPENVLVERGGRVRVTDFGLAHIDAEALPLAVGERPIGDSGVTFSGKVAGTPAYMAPEQFAADTTDERTDQFSFCVALWEALFGERPFSGESFHQIRGSVIAGALRPPPRGVSVPRKIVRALTRGLSRRPEDRFAKLEQLLDELRPVGTSRTPVVAAAVAVSLLLVGAVGLLGWRERTRCGREAAQSVAERWSGARRELVARQLEHLGLAPAVRGLMLARIDRHYGEWAETRTRVCEELRGRDATSGWARSAECLERADERAEAVVGLLGQALPEGESAARRLIERLPRSSSCVVEARRAPSLSTPERRRLWQGVEEAGLASLLGRHARAIDQARALLVDARALGDLGAASAIERTLASSLDVSLGRRDEAESTLRQAIRDADQAGDDAGSLLARLDLANLLALELNRPSEAEAIVADAKPWLARLGSPPYLELEFVAVRANAVSAAGHVAESLADYQRRFELAAEIDAESPRYFDAANGLAMAYGQLGRFDEAARTLERELEHMERIDAPPTHRTMMWTNLAFTRLSQGRLDDALACVERSDATLAPVRDDNLSFVAWNQLARGEILALRGDDARGDRDRALQLFALVLAHREVLRAADEAEALAGEARVLAARGHGDEAVPLGERAVRLAESQTDEMTLGLCHWALAVSLEATGRDPARAIKMAERALVDFGHPQQVFLRGRVEAWLAAARRPTAPPPR